MSDDAKVDTSKVVEAIQAKNAVPSNADVNKALADSAKEQAAANTGIQPLENKVAELLRKVNKVGELDKKFDQLLTQLNALTPQPKAAPIVEDSDEYMTIGQYKAYEGHKAQETIKQQQGVNFAKAVEMFPELDKSSENFDAQFYNLTDKYFGDINPNDPEAPLKAAKLAALDLDKIGKAASKKVLDDDARRSRKLSEGGIPSRDTKPEPKGKMNDQRLKNLLGVDPAKVAARIKLNPTRYGKGE